MVKLFLKRFHRSQFEGRGGISSCCSEGTLIFFPLPSGLATFPQLKLVLTRLTSGVSVYSKHTRLDDRERISQLLTICLSLHSLYARVHTWRRAINCPSVWKLVNCTILSFAYLFLCMLISLYIIQYRWLID